MSEAQILNAADKATRCCMRRGSRWRPEDWEDARQEALIGILDLLREKPDAHEGECFVCARWAIYSWMRMVIRSRTENASQLVEWAEKLIPAREESTALSNALVERLPDLLPLLHRQRSKRADMVDREIAFLRLMLEGYSVEGASVELRIPWGLAYRIREILLPKLERIRDGREHVVKPSNVQQASRDALARIQQQRRDLALQAEGRILAMRQSGMTLDQIAERTGRSRSGIHLILKGAASAGPYHAIERPPSGVLTRPPARTLR